jgi:hypothetical protein
MRYARLHSHELTTRTLVKVLPVAICHRNPPQTSSAIGDSELSIGHRRTNAASCLPPPSTTLAAWLQTTCAPPTGNDGPRLPRQRSCPRRRYTENTLRSHLTYYLTGIQPKSKFAVSSLRRRVQTTNSWLKRTVAFPAVFGERGHGSKVQTAGNNMSSTDSAVGRSSCQPPTRRPSRRRSPMLRAVCRSELFGNVAVFGGGPIAAHGSAEPSRLNERDPCCQNGK